MGPIRTALPWCFGPARPVFERSFTGSAGRCETESDVWQYGLPAAGPIRTLLPWCFGPARPVLSEALLAVLEGVRLVSRQFRKRRLAVWAAGRGPDPYCTAMVFWLCETGL